MPAVSLERLPELSGQPLGHTEWREMTQDRVDAFADVTEDHNYIHVDPERAKATPFGTTIAHGFLTLSMLTHLSAGTSSAPPNPAKYEGVMMGINYGFNKVRFPAAVPTGTRVRARAELVSVEELGDGWWHVVTKFTVEGEGQEKPVCVAEAVGRALID